MTILKCSATHEQVEWSDYAGEACWMCGAQGVPCWPTTGKAQTYFVCAGCGDSCAYEYDRRNCERSHVQEAVA